MVFFGCVGWFERACYQLSFEPNQPKAILNDSQLIIEFEPTNANDVPNLQESKEIQRIVKLFLCLFFFLTKKFISRNQP
jgi:hypothetical protein